MTDGILTFSLWEEVREEVLQVYMLQFKVSQYLHSQNPWSEASHTTHAPLRENLEKRRTNGKDSFYPRNTGQQYCPKKSETVKSYVCN